MVSGQWLVVSGQWSVVSGPLFPVKSSQLRVPCSLLSIFSFA
ncbi:MAG: hypothetical protein ACKO9R_00320 [Dolichospermum sp.]